MKLWSLSTNIKYARAQSIVSQLVESDIWYAPTTPGTIMHFDFRMTNWHFDFGLMKSLVLVLEVKEKFSHTTALNILRIGKARQPPEYLVRPRCCCHLGVEAGQDQFAAANGEDEPSIDKQVGPNARAAFACCFLSIYMIIARAGSSLRWWCWPPQRIRQLAMLTLLLVGESCWKTGCEYGSPLSAACPRYTAGCANRGRGTIAAEKPCGQRAAVMSFEWMISILMWMGSARLWSRANLVVMASWNTPNTYTNNCRKCPCWKQPAATDPEREWIARHTPPNERCVPAPSPSTPRAAAQQERARLAKHWAKHHAVLFATEWTDCP